MACDHRSGTRLSFYLLHPDILSRRFAVEDGKCSVDIGNEDQVLFRSEVDIPGSRRNLTDGCDMACPRIDGDEIMVFAGRKELMVGRIDGKIASTSAGRKLPGSCNATRRCVDASDFAQRGQSYEDGTISVCYS